VVPALLRYSLRIVDYGIAWSRGSSSKPQDFKWSTAKTKRALDAKIGSYFGLSRRRWPDPATTQTLGWNDAIHGQLTDVAVNFKIADWKSVQSAPVSGEPRKDFGAAYSHERSPAFVDTIRKMFSKYLLKAGEKPPRKACHYSTT
jgi:hypothetical protein